MLEEGGEIFRGGGIGWRVRNKVVVVGEDGPCFKLPTEIRGGGEERLLEEVQAVGCAKVMEFLVGAGGDEVGAGVAEAMCRGVGPWRGSLGSLG